MENKPEEFIIPEDKAGSISLQKKKNAVRKELHEMGVLKKGAHNDFDNYDYFSEAQYKELFGELLSKHGIEYYNTEVDYGTFEGTEKQPFGRVVTMDFTLIDMDTNYKETSRHTGEGLDRGDKAGYKATTGALKKFFSSTFLVATGDDPEREDEQPKKKPPVTAKRRPVSDLLSPGQEQMLKSLFANRKAELSKIMRGYKKVKLQELTKAEASKIIEEWKGKENE